MQPLSAHRPRIVSDPAPSRWGYRMSRLWLTPLFRALLRTGIPCLVVICGVMFYLSDPDHKEAFITAIADARASIEERPEFMVNLMEVDGASAPIAEAIRERLPLDLPQSSFDLDLNALRQEVRNVAAVRDATLRIRPGNVLEISIVERVPTLVWRGPAGLALIDADGVVLSYISERAVRADLPLIAGEGADVVVGEALDILMAAAPVAERLRGLVRVGARRWTVVLDRDQEIFLPEEGAVAALERVILLDGAKDLLARDVRVVDLRNPRRPTLRMGETGTQELRRIKSIEFGGQGQ